MESFHLDSVLVLIGAGLAVALLVQGLRQNTVLGYLAAGLVIGPHSLGWISNSETLHTIAHLGVVFLLFEIGLEMSLERLRAARRWLLSLGVLQVAVTMGALTLALGPLLGDWAAATLLAGALALSSTAMVVKILSDSRELSTAFGQRVFSILLVQDLAVVPLLLLVPLLSGPAAAGVGDAIAAVLGLAQHPVLDILLALLKAALAIALAIVIGRFLLRPLFVMIARRRSTELFTALVLFSALGFGLLTEHLGVSMALGAFMAGLMLSESAFRHQIEAEIRPFQQLLLGLFFMSIGMQADLSLVVAQPWMMLGLLLLMLTVKAIVILVIARSIGLGLGESVHMALTLAQGGEFAFVLATQAIAVGLLDGGLFAGAILPAVVLSMILTPLMIRLGQIAQERLERLAPKGLPEEAIEEESAALDSHVIICGFGRVGGTVARVLNSVRHPYIAIEADPVRVMAARAQGFNVFYGDAADPDILRATGADHARAIILTANNPERMEDMIAMARALYPAVPLIARARDLAHKRRLRELGVSASVPEVLEGALQLGARALAEIGHPSDDIELLVDALRHESLTLDALPRQDQTLADGPAAPPQLRPVGLAPRRGPAPARSTGAEPAPVAGSSAPGREPAAELQA